MIQLIKLLEEITAENITSPQPVQAVQPTTDSLAPTKLTKEQKKRLVDIVGRYNEYGKSVRHDGNLSDMAKVLKEISHLAETYVVTECGDFIEANTAKRKMQELRKYSESFVKLAEDIHPKQQQLEALYEDVGRVLEVFFEIHDAVPSVFSVGNPTEPTMVDPHTIEK